MTHWRKRAEPAPVTAGDVAFILIVAAILLASAIYFGSIAASIRNIV